MTNQTSQRPRRIVIALISAVTLSAELCFSRLFSVLFFHHLAFLILSTALFGFGLSGMLLALSRRIQRRSVDSIVVFSCLGLGATLLLATTVVTSVQVAPGELIDQPLHILPLLLHYSALVLPFFFSGLVVGAYLTRLPAEAPALYGWDLLAAGLAAAATPALVSWSSPQHLLVAGAAVTVFAGALAAPPGHTTLRRSLAGAGLILLLLGPVLAGSFKLPLRHIFFQKHGRFYDAPSRPIEYSAWSLLARIDVLQTPPNKLIYIDGGSNVSFMVPSGGNVLTRPPIVRWRSRAYLWMDHPRVLVIGPGGGEDVLYALSHHPKSVTAVELDPVICDLVTGRYAPFTGNIFHHSLVRLENDEGRSFLRRSGETYDLILQVHNISPAAFASGAFNLSETYLLTEESFLEMLDHLSPDGVICINRWGTLRLASLAYDALRGRGVEEPDRHVIATFEKGAGGETFYLKKSAFTEQDVQVLLDSDRRIELLYAPRPDQRTRSNAYYRLLRPELRPELLASTPLDLTSPTDDRPFFNHFSRFARFDNDPEILTQASANVVPFSNTGDLMLLVTLGEGALLAALFLLVPLATFGRKGSSGRARLSTMLYFGGLGAGFIFLEICLIQQLILYLGHPVYSLSLVIATLLGTMGLGSHLAGALAKRRPDLRTLARLAPLVAAGMTLVYLAGLDPLLDRLLLLGFTGRALVCVAALAPLGLVLGMPMPLGLCWLDRADARLLPWAWALNGYFTVVGSVLTVILAIVWGFSAVFVAAATLYLIAGLGAWIAPESG